MQQMRESRWSLARGEADHSHHGATRQPPISHPSVTPHIAQRSGRLGSESAGRQPSVRGIRDRCIQRA